MRAMAIRLCSRTSAAGSSRTASSYRNSCPVTFEAEDGYDSVEWAAAQPWSNGKVGTFGNSYNAWTQWRLAPTRPPHLVAMWASGMGPTHHDWEVGGVFRPGRALHWLTGTIGPDTQRRLDPPAGPETVEEWELHHVENRFKWLWFLPWEELPKEAVGDLGPQLHAWLASHHKLIFDFRPRFRQYRLAGLPQDGVVRPAGRHGRNVRRTEIVGPHRRGARVSATDRRAMGPTQLTTTARSGKSTSAPMPRCPTWTSSSNGSITG